MREEVGGVNYDDEAKLKFGSPKHARFSAAKDPSPRAEWLLRSQKIAATILKAKNDNADWRIWKIGKGSVDARMRLLELKNSQTKFGMMKRKFSAPLNGATWRFCCARHRARRKSLRNNLSVRKFH